MKLHKTPFFLLLCYLLTLTMLSGCGSGQQAAGQSTDGSEFSSPEQSVEEVHPEEDLAQPEVPNSETDDDGGEGAVPTAPQSPGTSTVQTMNLSSRKARQQLQMWNCRYRKHPEGLQSRRNRRLEIRQWTIPGVRRRAQR